MALNHEQAHLALQARLLTLSVCTTGSATLSATATGYARAAGSFITDGFAAGMEITPTGFTQTSTSVITAVTATTLTVASGRTVESAGAGRTLAAVLPATRGWENIAINPVSGGCFIEADYVPATVALRSMPVTGGTLEDTGLYVVRWYGPAKVGMLALTRAATAVLALFKPGLSLTLTNGTALRVRGDIAPWRTQVRPAGGSGAVVTITVPWRLYSLNT